MRQMITLVFLISLLGTWMPQAYAGSSQDKAALRRAAAWAAETVGRELPSAPKVKASGVKSIGVIVRPEAEVSSAIYQPLSNAIAGLDSFTEVWPKGDITAFVDMVFLHPEEPRYDAESLLKLGGTFENAQALLLVRYALAQGEDGATEIDINLSLWDGKTAQKLWGADHHESVNLTRVIAIDSLIDAGKIDEAVELLMTALAGSDSEAQRGELEQLQRKATRLKDHAAALQRIQALVDQSKLDNALKAIGVLYGEGDGALRDALWGLLTDTRTKILTRAVSLTQAGKFAEAAAEVERIEKAYAGDADLARMLGPIHRQLQATKVDAARVEAEKAAREERRQAADARAARDHLEKRVDGYRGEQAETDSDNRRNLMLAIGGALILVLIVLSLAISKRRRVSRRNIGLDELESEADQAERVREVLTKDADVRASMLRELDRAEDALAEAHHQAQAAEKSAVAQELHGASGQLQELRRRVKLAQGGDASDFLKGRLPKKNLEALIAYMPAVGGQMQELGKEAMAAQDAMAAGGSPSKNLKLISGLSLQIQGKLSEREAFFRTMS